MTEHKLYNVAFLSTFPPRECGLATFTKNLVNAINGIHGDDLKINTKIIAISNNTFQNYQDVAYQTIQQHNQKDYLELAQQLNQSDIDLLVIEHEYGIFGGDHGNYVLDLINHLDIPLITTFHTILPNPNEKQLSISQKLSEKSTKVVTMANNTKTLLNTIYQVPLHKIDVIHHGVPYREFPTRLELKKEFNYANSEIISTFGLLSPGKGIEYAIEAMVKVTDKNPNAIYLILGRSHPDQIGETYRNNLESLVKKFNLENNVVFVNQYLSIDELIRYIQMSDIYLTPYLSKDQAVSGTLAYAVGYGKAIVSTPYLYAEEMLGSGRGKFAHFKNSDSIAQSINSILSNPLEKLTMENNTLTLGKTMYWHNIANIYHEIFLETIAHCNESR